MKRILAPILLLTLLFPSLAQGQSLNDWVGKGKGLLCETTGMGCPESVDAKDLVERDGVYFKKRTDVPFTGKTKGKTQGTYRNGKKHGLWVRYHDNGQLSYKGTYKNGKTEGPWVFYNEDGQLSSKGNWKDGKRDGHWVGYNRDGQIEWRRTYKNGVKDGPWVGYNKDGQIEWLRTYKNGVKVK
jgi:antitoxin component YwqK of YwqJK toxin-antitoxin module